LLDALPVANPDGATLAGHAVTNLVLSLRDVGKIYASGSLSVEALRHVDLDVWTGEYVAITGPSGSGKSTLMHILGCLDTPTSGKYLLAGDDVSTMDETQLAHVRNRRIGFVFQRFHLMAQMSACRNVELPLLYSGVPAAQRRVRALDALHRVGLEGRTDHRPGELSGGQQQRVAVARALVTEPDLILADEPTGNLDAAAGQNVPQILADYAQQGAAVLLVTHDPRAAQMAGRIVDMRAGRMA
jgi:putative ABC transport system ATP-binding protein